MPSSHPFIEADALQRLNSMPMNLGFDSLSLDPAFDSARLELLRDPNTLFTSDSEPVTPHQKALLYLAAERGDLFLAYEALRVGCRVDWVSFHKQDTPLWVALYSYVESLQPSQLRSSLLAERAARFDALRREFLIRFLVEQHADVNFMKNGRTPLHLACQSGNWDVIDLLLKHGADPIPPGCEPPLEFLRTTEEKNRFKALIQNYPSTRERPSRICPCGSCLLAAVCHANEKQYPPRFLCRCASGKVYGNCCRHRRIVVVESWSEFRKRLERGGKKPFLYGRGDQSDTLHSILHNLHLVQAIALRLQLVVTNDLINSPIPEDIMMPYTLAIHNLDGMLARKMIEPGYAYVQRRVRFWPRPRGRTESKVAGNWKQKEWNQLVDEYIDLASDPRHRDEMELGLKISSSGGALIRVCEGFNFRCGKLEGIHVTQLKLCGKCKIAPYCSRACQTASWKDGHKKVCGEINEQPLLSQRNMQRFVASPHLDRLAALDHNDPNLDTIGLVDYAALIPSDIVRHHQLD